MIKLALIGKEISHSKSPEIYKQLISAEHTYDLIDCNSEDDIPSLELLEKKYAGINITSPYKKFFLEKLPVDQEVESVDAINCLYKKAGMFYGANTDYLALKDILQKFKTTNIAILGEGVMGRVCKKILRQEFKCKPHIFSRGQDGDLSRINYDSFDVVINCCSRDFCFDGVIDKNVYFFDLNYSLNHTGSIPNYHDGLELLLLQAKYAVKKWHLSV